MANRAGITGIRGIYYDYVWAGNGLFVQSQNELIAARVIHHEGITKGLQPIGEKLELKTGRLPASQFELILGWMMAEPEKERFFAVAKDEERYKIITPVQEGTGSRVTYDRPSEQLLAEFHSHGHHGAFFSTTDDADEQGFRIYGVLGKTNTPQPKLALRVGVYGHFGPALWENVFDGPKPPWLNLDEGEDDGQ